MCYFVLSVFIRAYPRHPRLDSFWLRAGYRAGYFVVLTTASDYYFSQRLMNV